MTNQFFRSDLGVCISDLFFNSEEVTNISQQRSQIVPELMEPIAQEWLNNYPYFKQFVTASELSTNFVERV